MSDQAAALTERYGGEWRQPISGPSWWWACADGRMATVRGKGRLLKGTNHGLYRGVMTGDNRNLAIHVLVCEAFHGPRPPNYETRHLDGDRFNNAAANLQWGTPRQNQTDRIRHGTDQAGERNAVAKLNWESVRQMRALRQSAGLTYQQLGDQFGVHLRTAYDAVEGKTWK